jgi:two-component system chemotaxis response regulator CheY
MNVVVESPEHHFLTLIEKIKGKEEEWFGVHIALSKKLSHSNLVSDLNTINARLDTLIKDSDALFEEVKLNVDLFKDTTIYKFHDGDLMIFVRTKDKKEQDLLFELYKKFSEKLSSKICDYSALSQSFYHFEKLSDKKIISAQKIASYRAMGDNNKVSSIQVRRKKREAPLVLVVEDDRFTATYASNILSKEHEVVLAKNGEEAIEKYIEYAPDIVFLDIHLPGLNGHETLEAIKQTDKSAYIVMLSVDTVKTNIVSASEQGAAGFLKKPFSQDRLLAAVSKSPFIKDIKARSA